MSYTKKDLFGIDIALVDYESACDTILDHAVRHQSFGVSALAVHGLVLSIRDRAIGERVRSIDMVVPDGQPLRWALNGLCSARLKDRVYGPTLTLHVLERAADQNLRIYLYGSTDGTLKKFSGFIEERFAGIQLCGIHPDRFRESTPEEDAEDVRKINDSGAHIVLVGRGCPRQEIWVADHLGKIHAAMLAVGAAFDFHSGTLKQAPKWMQDNGLEWCFRLAQEPTRLWKRYLFTNSYFSYLVLKHIISSTAIRKDSCKLQ